MVLEGTTNHRTDTISDAISREGTRLELRARRWGLKLPFFSVEENS